jgi:hypothetical protein
MTCPQCKEPYRIYQKTSSLYKLANYYNKRIDRIVPVIAGLGALSGAYVALTVHGWYSLCTFCGEDLTFRLFSDENWSRPSYVIRMLFGMQFIPVWLLASRTKYLDSVLPFIPLVFIEQDNVALLPHPHITLFPSPRYETLPPAFTMCVLPWLRIVYNKLWERIVVPWERKWEDSAATGPANIGGGDRENNVVLQVNNGNGGDNDPVVEGNIRVARQADDMEDVLLATNLTTLCRKIVGALLLPDACALAGFLLGQLPWVKRRIPDRFSRNVIGGIVFLVLKVNIPFCVLALIARTLLQCGTNIPHTRVERASVSWTTMPEVGGQGRDDPLLKALLEYSNELVYLLVYLICCDRGFC